MHETVPEKSPRPQRHRFSTRRLVFLGLIFLGLCSFALWWRSGSRLMRMATHPGSFHLTSVTFSTQEGTKVLTDPQGLKYLEERIAKATIEKGIFEESGGDPDRRLHQGITVTSTWSFSDFGTERRSMVLTSSGIFMYIPGILVYGVMPTPPFVYFFQDTRYLQVYFDEKPPPSVKECCDWTYQIQEARWESRKRASAP